MNDIKDGTYSVDVRLTGGSGRAKIESPARLTAEDGGVRVTLRWDSPYYDYMEVEGRHYYPANSGGDSVFVVDAELDRELSVRAETLAMSSPHMIDYTLYLDSATLRKNVNPAPFACAIAALALAATAAAAVRKKRKKHEK